MFRFSMRRAKQYIRRFFVFDTSGTDTCGKDGGEEGAPEPASRIGHPGTDYGIVRRAFRQFEIAVPPVDRQIHHICYPKKQSNLLLSVAFNGSRTGQTTSQKTTMKQAVPCLEPSDRDSSPATSYFKDPTSCGGFPQGQGCGEWRLITPPGQAFRQRHVCRQKGANPNWLRTVKQPKAPTSKKTHSHSSLFIQYNPLHTSCPEQTLAVALVLLVLGFD
ncbi:hypothetical protein B0T26DRAFT_315816 [Lasiosphaeria miniovina]|uniref:Uncharacterized protein n=1 Tax=Lasiosphaeria miniovina TaxID=1954250 RepID=A0AA40ALQ6_9PEZI|nr:uncharacterized protein B0T26DRAFT_315816 [Lasiosphaeria miniovina]KAK0718157.1 hypothetical protein B0T26DRAFT_315816 [Lasiosphaeria miniovina]